MSQHDTTERRHVSTAYGGGVLRARKKPVEVQAMLHDGDENHAQAIVSWINSSSDRLAALSWQPWTEGAALRPPRIHIPTLEGDMMADPGDYVIRGVKGEFYPCKPDIFLATYDVLPPKRRWSKSYCLACNRWAEAGCAPEHGHDTISVTVCEDCLGEPAQCAECKER